MGSFTSTQVKSRI